MNTIMSAIAVTAVMDTAACDDNNITVFSDIKVVVNQFGQTCFRDNNRDMNAFVYSIWFNNDIDT